MCTQRTRLATAILAVWLAANAAADQTFAYVATMSGTRVGEARVTVSARADEYRIFGRAWSTGLADLFTSFRSSFFARGRIVDGTAHVDEYRLSQRDSERSRELHVAAGRVTEIKDGRLRPERIAPEGPDVLTALFMRAATTTGDSGACAVSTGFHTGKHSYRLELRSMRAATMDDASFTYSGTALRCEYAVTDDEDERSRATVWLADVSGLVVPVRAEFSGGLNAGLHLAAN